MWNGLKNILAIKKGFKNKLKLQYEKIRSSYYNIDYSFFL